MRKNLEQLKEEVSQAIASEKEEWMRDNIRQIELVELKYAGELYVIEMEKFRQAALKIIN